MIRNSPGLSLQRYRTGRRKSKCVRQGSRRCQWWACSSSTTLPSRTARPTSTSRWRTPDGRNWPKLVAERSAQRSREEDDAPPGTTAPHTKRTGLVKKLGPPSPPPTQKTVSWGSEHAHLFTPPPCYRAVLARLRRWTRFWPQVRHASPTAAHPFAAATARPARARDWARARDPARCPHPPRCACKRH